MAQTYSSCMCMLIDHVLSRLVRGLLAILQVEGPNSPDVFTVPKTVGEFSN
jgi:hypothetical protein